MKSKVWVVYTVDANYAISRKTEILWLRDKLKIKATTVKKSGRGVDDWKEMRKSLRKRDGIKAKKKK